LAFRKKAQYVVVRFQLIRLKVQGLFWKIHEMIFF
jgi:hypothetical protein